MGIKYKTKEEIAKIKEESKNNTILRKRKFYLYYIIFLIKLRTFTKFIPNSPSSKPKIKIASNLSFS